MPFDIDQKPPQSPGLTLGEGAHLSPVDGHQVWWSERGAGLPVLMVHGGPGGQTRTEPLGWWQHQAVHWFALDQRGCGRSLPAGDTQHNTLVELVDDMERLRLQAGLDRWALAGGSWGAVVSLAYALRHPQRVTGLMLRSPFLGSTAEVDRYLAPWETWLGEAGKTRLGADAVALRRMFQPTTAPRQLETGLTRNEAEPLTFADEATLAQAWARFDDAQSVAGGIAGSGARWSPDVQAEAPPPSWAIFRHYASHGWSLAQPLLQSLQEQGEALRHLPLVLVHGDGDACCDPATSHALAAWHGAADHVEVPGAGHRMGQPVMAEALRDAAHRWLGRLI